MGALAGLCLGCGILSVWLALAAPVRSGTAADGDRSASPLHQQRITRRRQVAVVTAFIAGMIAYLLTSLAVAGVLAAIAGCFAPRVVESRRRQREAHRRRQAWPDVIDSLVSAVRAGMSLPEAVAAVGVRGPESVRPAFHRFAADYRSSGRFSDCILRLRDDLSDPVSDRIVEALLAARDVGGSVLGRMLRTLSDFVRQDLRLR